MDIKDNTRKHSLILYLAGPAVSTWVKKKVTRLQTRSEKVDRLLRTQEECTVSRCTFFDKPSNALAKRSISTIPVYVNQWRRQGGAWGGTCPPKICCAPPCAPQMKSVLCIKMHQKIFLKYNAADKPNGMKCDCIRIHALHGCVINNVIIQSTAIASLPATSFPESYLRSSGEMTRC